MKPVEKHTLSSAFTSLLRYQLLLPIILASLLTLAIMSYFAGEELQTQQERFNASISYIIEDFIRHASYELDAIAFTIPNASLEENNVSMQAQWSSHEIFDTLYLLDEHGIIETLVPIDQRYLGLDMSRREYYLDIDCALNINISEPFSSLRTGEPTVYISRCVDRGRLLVGELNLSTLQDTTSAGQPQLSQASVFIVASNGRVLAHPDFERVTMQENISNWEIVEVGLHGKNTTLYYWRDGNFWFGTVETINPMGWLIITEIPFSVVYGPYLGATGVMVFLLIFIFSIAAQRFSIKVQQQVVVPLTNLSASTDALASGDYEISETLSSNTYALAEIERLVSNFQNMSQSISSRETLLRESEKQYRRLVENSPNAILVHHEGIVVYANEAAIQLYKAKDESVLIGISILELTHADSKAMATARLKQIHEAGYTTVLPMAEQMHIKFNGEPFAAEITTSSIFFEGKYEAQTIIRDISRRKDEELRLKHLASHDFLTDLPNRFFFEDVLQHTLAKAKRTQEIGAILYLDIDGFKAINDAYGHAVGDIVLQAVAKKIQLSLREGDIVARLGGDEFVILLETLKDKKDASQVASNLLNACAEPIITGGEEIHISLSIGISLFPQDGQTAQLLLQTADAAMYGAKTEGKHRYKYYSSEMRAQTEERVAIISALQHALEREEFCMLYQPQINTQTGMWSGLEALLRWKHPTLGLIRPAQFIDLAEETGLILPIGEWILRTVCEQIKIWQEFVPDTFHIAVNLSNLQLRQPNIVHLLQNILTSSEIPPAMLELELMENIVFQNPTEALDKLFKLKSLGIKLAIDDFGTGYSMLGYLAHFPFDHLKIDQRLAPNILVDPKEVAIVSGVITISQKLGLTVIAEGVETIEQIDFYQSLGCHDFQGWYYSREINAEEITKKLKENVAREAKSTSIQL